MIRKKIVFLLSFLLFEAVSVYGSEFNTNDFIISNSIRIIELLQNEEYETIQAMAYSDMKEALSPKNLRNYHRVIYEDPGKYQGLDIRKTVTNANHTVYTNRNNETLTNSQVMYNVVITQNFEKQTVDLILVYNTNTNLLLLFISDISRNQSYVIPSYISAKARNLGYFNYELKTDDRSVKGLLILPKRKEKNPRFPLVIMVHDLHFNDRDLSISLVNKPYRDLAYGLAKKGFAVALFDNSLHHHDSTNKLNPFEILIEDSLLVYDKVPKHEFIDSNRVFFLGTGLGASILPKIAAQRPQSAGFVMINPFPSDIGSIFLHQTNHLINRDDYLTKEEKYDLTQAEIDYADSRNPGNFSNEPFGLPESFWNDVYQYHPEQWVPYMPAPVLIVQSGKDQYLPPESFDAYQNMKDYSHIKLMNFRKLNHFLFIQKKDFYPEYYLKPMHVPYYNIKKIYRWMKGVSSKKMID